ncbi:MAG: hypothetical protein IJY23_00165 [Clostridia bacterium]|nr:hypothetical protein [Clostridia bacterium]
MSQAVAVPEEVRYKLCDMGYYNDAMKGYLIAGMRRMGFSEIEIRKAVLGMMSAHDELTAEEAEKVYTEG